jgi:hypothetical protein
MRRDTYMEKPHEKLAKLCDEVGLTAIAANARMFAYHDFKSPFDFPETMLHGHLKEAMNAEKDPVKRSKIQEILAMHMSGEFDATYDESEEWARSPDGIAAMQDLAKR